MKIINYEDKYKQDLDRLLKEFSEETYDGKYDTDRFIDSHWGIYLLFKDDIAIGFSSFNINDYMGFQEDMLANNYLFISKPYRKSKAIYHLSILNGDIAEYLNMDCEHYYASEHTELLSRKLNSKEMFRAVIIGKDEILRERDRIKSILLRKK